MTRSRLSFIPQILSLPARYSALRRAVLETLESRRLLTATMPGDVRHEIMTVPLDGSMLTSSFITQPGLTYHLRGSGTTAFIDTPNGRRTDVEYYDYQAGPALDLSSPNLGSVDVGLKVVDTSGTALDGFHWGAYQSSHAYVKDFVGNGQALNLRYIDVPGFYGDNSGTLTFQIYEPVKVDVLRLSDAANLDWQQESTGSQAGQFYLNADLLGRASFVLDGVIGPDQSDAKALALWKIDPQGNSASRTAGKFSDTLANRTVNLTNSITGDQYTVTAGADKNENGVLETGEIERTMIVHVQTVPTPNPIFAASSSGDSVTVSWINNANNQTGFIVERATGSGAFDTFVTVGADEESHTFTGLTGGATYRFRVKAVNLALESGYSAEASATVMVAPSAPSALNAAPYDEGEDGAGIVLDWINSDHESDVEITRSTDSAFTQNITTLSGDQTDQTAYADNDVAAGVTYYYRVRATNGAGASAWSNTASFTAQQPVPVRPDSLYARATPDGVQLSWTDAAYNEIGYLIERSPDEEFGTNTVQVATLDPDSTSYLDTTATATATYYYRVIATGQPVSSPPSEASAAAVPGGAPLPPAEVYSTRISDTTAVIEWIDESDNEEGFEIQRSTDPDFDPLATESFSVGHGQTTFTDEGLSASVTYYYQVRAYNAFDPLEGSGGLSASTGDTESSLISTGFTPAAASTSGPKFYLLKQGASSLTLPASNGSDWFYSGTAVHVTAWTSTIRQYDPVTYRYSWDFGDPGSAYNGGTDPAIPISQQLHGMNAAHVYALPAGLAQKSYTIRLTITHPNGTSVVKTGAIVIKAETRPATYVANQIDFNNLMNEYATAPTSMLSNRRIYFKRGQTFNIGQIAYGGVKHFRLDRGVQNVLFGSYLASGSPSSLPKPIINSYNGDTNNDKAPETQIFRLSQFARNIHFRDLEFDSQFRESGYPERASKAAPQVVALRGASNVTFLNCDLSRVASISAEGRTDTTSAGKPVLAQGVLIQGCKIVDGRSVGHYVVYGSDSRVVTMQGNSFAPDYITEHLLRFTGKNEFIFVHDNVLRIDDKDPSSNSLATGASPLRLNTGLYGDAYMVVTRNRIKGDKIYIGPITVSGTNDNGESSRYQLFDGNTIEKGYVAIGVGLRTSAFRNNVFVRDDFPYAFRVDTGRSSGLDRPATDIADDVWIAHNTRYIAKAESKLLSWGDSEDNGQFIRMRRFHLHNNLTASIGVDSSGSKVSFPPAYGVNIAPLNSTGDPSPKNAWKDEILRSLQQSPSGWTIGGNAWNVDPNKNDAFVIDGNKSTLGAWNVTYTRALSANGSTVDMDDFSRKIIVDSAFPSRPYMPSKSNSIANYLSAATRFDQAAWDAYGKLRPTNLPTFGAVQR